MNDTAPKTDRFRVVILILTLINTIFAAALSGLQVDANIRADKASRDSQYFAQLAANELVRIGHQNAYDSEVFTNTVKVTQQSLVMEFTALELEQKDENEIAAKLHSQSQIEQARSETGTALSVFFTDPRYAPATEDGLPDLEAYLLDQMKLPNELVVKQNTATDEYHTWNKKADGYVAVLTVIAIAFFLLGLAQSTTRLRLFFAISALVIMSIAAIWTGLILIA
jgi:hypothetical protein